MNRVDDPLLPVERVLSTLRVLLELADTGKTFSHGTNLVTPAGTSRTCQCVCRGSQRGSSEGVVTLGREEGVANNLNVLAGDMYVT